MAAPAESAPVQAPLIVDPPVPAATQLATPLARLITWLTGSARWMRTTVDLLGGTAGGVALALVGHPLDLVKTRMQTQNSPYAGVLDCIKKTASNEGLRSFYKGLSPPLVMTGYTNAVLFTANGFMQSAIRGDTDPAVPLTGAQVLLATWLTAPIYVSALTPIEIVKVRLQIQSSERVKLYNGPFDCVKQIIGKDGVRGLFQGFSPTLASRIVGLPFYLGGYWLFKSLFTKLNGGEASFGVSLVAGGFAGISFWTANYPLDFLKTRLQEPRVNGVKVGLWESAKHVLRTTGIRGFYKGYAACILRAFPANAAQFSANDYVTKHLRERHYH